MAREIADLSFRIPMQRYDYDTFAYTLCKRFFNNSSSISNLKLSYNKKNTKTFDLRISKKLTCFVFKHYLTRLYKDDLFSSSNRFLDSNSGIPGKMFQSLKCLK